MRHVFSLSTIPPRFAKIGPVLKSLIAQTSRPEAIELYIPGTYRRFPQWGGALPEVPEGVRIVRVEDDLGPATKVLPAARAYRGQAVELLYVDDDIVFEKDWAQAALDLRKAHPEAAVCGGGVTMQRLGLNWVAKAPLPRAVLAPLGYMQPGYQARRLLSQAFSFRGGTTTLSTPFRKIDRSGYVEIAEGNSGVALRPEFFDDAAFDIPPVLWTVDDVWLSGHLARRGIPIWADKTLNKGRALLEVSRTQSLFRAVIEGADRDAANHACVDYMRKTYGIWGGEATQST